MPCLGRHRLADDKANGIGRGYGYQGCRFPHLDQFQHSRPLYGADRGGALRNMVVIRGLTLFRVISKVIRLP